jgi:hypothetical protein
MNQADVSAICFVLPGIVFLAVLWALLHQREQQLREVQGERVLKSLREVLDREKSANPDGNVDIC